MTRSKFNAYNKHRKTDLMFEKVEIIITMISCFERFFGRVPVDRKCDGVFFSSNDGHGVLGSQIDLDDLVACSVHKDIIKKCKTTQREKYRKLYNSGFRCTVIRDGKIFVSVNEALLFRVRVLLVVGVVFSQHILTNHTPNRKLIYECVG